MAHAFFGLGMGLSLVWKLGHVIGRLQNCTLWGARLSWKNRYLPTIGGCLPTCKKVCVCVRVFGGPLFLFPLCFCSLFWNKRPPKTFSCNYKLFFLVCSPERPVFKILLFFLFCVFPCFPFVFPPKLSSFFFAFYPSTPFWEDYFGGGFFFLFFAAFPLLFLLVSLKQTFLTSPFWNLSSFHFSFCIFFSSAVFALFSWCIFLPFCFYVGFVFGMFSLTFDLALFYFGFAFRLVFC